MTIRGHVKNGVIILDEPATLPEGTEVRIEAVPHLPAESKPRRVGGQWAGKIWMADDFDEMPEDLREAFGMNGPVDP